MYSDKKIVPYTNLLAANVYCPGKLQFAPLVTSCMPRHCNWLPKPQSAFPMTGYALSCQIYGSQLLNLGHFVAP